MALQQAGFFGMLSNLYSAVGTVSGVLIHFANALANLGKWAEASTGAFVDEAEADRQIKLLEAKLKREQYLREHSLTLPHESAPALTQQ